MKVKIVFETGHPEDLDHEIDIDLQFRLNKGDLVDLKKIVADLKLENKLPGYVLDYIEGVDIFGVEECFLEFVNTDTGMEGILAAFLAPVLYPAIEGHDLNHELN